MIESSHWINKCRSFETGSIEEMEDELNNFFDNKFILASPLFNIKDRWYCMVYYKIPPVLNKNEFKEKIKEDNDQKPSEKMIYSLTHYYGYSQAEANSLTFQQAYDKIKELKQKKKR